MCIYVYIYICMYIYMCVCVCIYIYIYTSICRVVVVVVILGVEQFLVKWLSWDDEKGNTLSIHSYIYLLLRLLFQTWSPTC